MAMYIDQEIRRLQSQLRGFIIDDVDEAEKGKITDYEKLLDQELAGIEVVCNREVDRIKILTVPQRSDVNTLIRISKHLHNIQDTVLHDVENDYVTSSMGELLSEKISRLTIQTTRALGETKRKVNQAHAEKCRQQKSLQPDNDRVKYTPLNPEELDLSDEDDVPYPDNVPRPPRSYDGRRNKKPWKQ